MEKDCRLLPMIPEYGGTTSPEHLRMYDRNFKFPQNSKEEVSIDTASHKTWIDPISDDDTYVQI